MKMGVYVEAGDCVMGKRLVYEARKAPSPFSR